MKNKSSQSIVNKKAYFDYEVLKEYDAGIVLRGSEVKSIRQGQVNLKGNFVQYWKDGLYVEGMHISKYKYATSEILEPKRMRKLLLKKREIEKILTDINQKGISAVVLEVYFKNKLVKAKLGIVRGKKLHDKRASLKEKDQIRQTQKVLKTFMN